MDVALLILGLVVGCFGTLIGAGGGFLLMPVLLFLYPHDEPRTLASISLGVVFCNALSGSIAYIRQGKTDLRAGLLFSAAAVPGSILGAITVGWLPRAAFEIILGIALIGAGALLLFSTKREPESANQPSDRFGPRMRYSRLTGTSLSFVVGFVSSLLGIGGGIIHVPSLVHLLGFPVHVATATSHFVLASTAGAGTVTHILTGTFHDAWRRTIAIGAGALIGAQIGAWWAKRATSVLIMRALAIALLLAGPRIVVYAIWR